MKIVNPATGAVIADIAADNAAAVRRKYEAARAGQPTLGEGADPQAPRRDRRVPRAASSREHETLARTLTQRSGQADPPVAERAQRAARTDRFLPRRVGARAARGEGLRRRRAEDRRADHARAARRRRQHLGVELSVLRRQQRVRSGARRRQRGALQAVRVRDADRARDRRDAARGRRAARRVRAGDRRRRDRRRADCASRSTASSSRARTRPARGSPRPRAGG